MKEIIRYGLILALICMVAAGLLAGVHAATKERIAAGLTVEEEASLKEVLPQAEHFLAVKKGNEILYYKATGRSGDFLGVAFKASAKGYSSDIQTMVGMLKDGSLSAIKILFQNETPGLGSRVTENKFMDQFKNKNPDALGGVQAITGATISSKAVIDSVKKKAEEIARLMTNEK